MSIVNSFFACGVQRFAFARIDEEKKMRPSCCARTPCWPPPLLRRREDGRGALHLQMVPAMIKEPTATNTCLEEFQQLLDATDGEQFAKALTNLAVHSHPCQSWPGWRSTMMSPS